MKQIFTLLFFIFFSTASFGQIGGGWDWAFNTGSMGPEVRHFAYKSNGDILFVGSAFAAANFGSTTLTAPAIGTTPGSIKYFGKISPAGVPTIIKSYANPNFTIDRATTDSGGNFYLSGSITNTLAADFGNGITYTANANIAYVAKLNANGEAQWVKTFTFGNTGSISLQVHRIAVSKLGNIFIVGYNANTSNNSGKYNAPIYKLDNNGNTLWYKDALNTSSLANFNETRYSLTDKFIDDNENVHLLNYGSNQTFIFDGETLTAPLITVGGSSYTFHISLDANGNKRFSNAYKGTGSKLYVERTTGNCLMAWAQYETSSGPFTNVPTYTLGSNANYYNGYVSISSNGNTLLKNSRILFYGFNDEVVILKADGSLVMINKMAISTAYGIGADYLYTADAVNYAVGVFETDPSWNTIKFITGGKSNETQPTMIAALGDTYALVTSFNNTITGAVTSTSALPTTVFGNTTLTGFNAASNFATAYGFYSTSASFRADVAFVQCKSANFPMIGSTTWIGLNNNWNDPNNWSNGVPTSLLKATFNNGSANYPSTFTSPTSATLQINTGASVTLPTTLTLLGGVKNDGTIKINNAGFFQGFGCTEWKGNGSVEFLGSAAPSFFMSKQFTNAIILNSGITTYYDMEISSVTFNTTAGTFNLNNKTLKITNPLPTSISGTTSSNYFYGGTLQRAINSTGVYEFPIGSSSNFQSATINVNGLTGVNTLSAIHTSGAVTGTAPNTTFTGVAITSALNGGWFSINPNTQPTAGSYSITLKIKGSTNTTTNVNRYAVIKRNNSTSAWAVNGTYVLASTDGTTVTSTINALTSFSDFAIGIGASSLPVSIIGFTAKANNNKVDLAWQTSTETNNKGFNIMHSIDGATFTNIGFAAGKGMAGSYTHTHALPIQGINYYRLEQIDDDGKKSLTETKAVTFTGKETAVTIYPNPVVSSINFNKFFVAGSSIQIINSNGALIEQGFINGNTYKPRQLATGMYKVVVVEKNSNAIFTNNMLVQ